MKINRVTRKRLGELLLEEGILSQEDIQTILKEQQRTSERFGEILIRLEFATERDVAMCLVSQFHVPFLDVRGCTLNPDLCRRFPESLMREQLFAPIDEIGAMIVVAISGPLEEEIFTQIEEISGKEVQTYISTVASVKAVLDSVFNEEKGD